MLYILFLLSAASKESQGSVVLCDKQQLTLCVFNLGIGRVTAIRGCIAVVNRPRRFTCRSEKKKGNPLSSVRFSQALRYLSVPLWLQPFLLLSSSLHHYSFTSCSVFVLRPVANKGLKSAEFGRERARCAYHSLTSPSQCWRTEWAFIKSRSTAQMYAAFVWMSLQARPFCMRLRDEAVVCF